MPTADQVIDNYIRRWAERLRSGEITSREEKGTATLGGHVVDIELFDAVSEQAGMSWAHARRRRRDCFRWSCGRRSCGRWSCRLVQHAGTAVRDMQAPNLMPLRWMQTFIPRAHQAGL